VIIGTNIGMEELIGISPNAGISGGIEGVGYQTEGECGGKIEEHSDGDQGFFGQRGKARAGRFRLDHQSRSTAFGLTLSSRFSTAIFDSVSSMIDSAGSVLTILDLSILHGETYWVS
jgi:hypothetical protein